MSTLWAPTVFFAGTAGAAVEWGAFYRRRSDFAARPGGPLPVCTNCILIFQIPFIALVKPPFKSSEDYHVSVGEKNRECGQAGRRE
jgi:hypothetical protein